MVCDGCKAVIASIGPDDRMASWLIHEAEQRARSHGAQINVASVTCAECLSKEKYGVAESPSGDPCHDNFEID